MSWADVSPSAVPTSNDLEDKAALEMQRQRVRDAVAALPEEQKQLMLKSIPLGRLGEPEEIAGVVSFLVSESGSYITGENIHVNGGMYMA